MDIDTEELLRHIKSREKYNGEVEAYIRSMSKLPQYDYSKFYESFPEYENVVTQGDTINGIAVINLPDATISRTRVLVLSNTCDMDVKNKRKYEAKMLYAPVMRLNAYKSMLEVMTNDDGERKYSDKDIQAQLNQIRNQKVSQIFYLPKGKNFDEEGIVFFDTICSIDNSYIDRDNLNDVRATSLSMYGWHILLVKLSYFFTKLTDDTIELRLKAVTNGN